MAHYPRQLRHPPSHPSAVVVVSSEEWSMVEEHPSPTLNEWKAVALHSNKVKQRWLSSGSDEDWMAAKKRARKERKGDKRGKERVEEGKMAASSSSSSLPLVLRMKRHQSEVVVGNVDAKKEGKKEAIEMASSVHSSPDIPSLALDIKQGKEVMDMLETREALEDRRELPRGMSKKEGYPSLLARILPTIVDTAIEAHLLLGVLSPATHSFSSDVDHYKACVNMERRERQEDVLGDEVHSLDQYGLCGFATMLSVLS